MKFWRTRITAVACLGLFALRPAASMAAEAGPVAALVTAAQTKPVPASAATAALKSPAVGTPAAPDSGAAARMILLREGYDRASKLRQSGDAAAAMLAAEKALGEISAELARNPDATFRRDLNELQPRYEGLRDGARHDVAEDAVPVEPGNEADDGVLNAPATEDLQPQYNTDVYKWIEFFTGNGRSTFERWLKRSGRYMNLFRAILQKEGLPPDLVHLVFVESGFNLNARSVSAAVGPWQFLGSTSRLFGLDVNQWVDERKDPEKSTVAAARYLKHLYSIFGDWPLALASYNAGEGTVLRAIKSQGTTNYWDLRLPRQTEEYVPQFMAVLAITREPGKYGFDEIQLDDPMQFDEVALKGAVDLRSLATLAECSLEELKLLNPAVAHHAMPGKGGVTTVRVPRGKGSLLTRKLAAGARLPQVDLTVNHRVKRGETLQSIAAEYHVSAQRLARENGVGRKHPLRFGMVLSVPAPQASPALADAGDPRASTSYVPPRSIRAPARISGQSSAEGRSTHTVKRGQTMASIAGKYDCTASDIMRWNHLATSSVRPGARLKIRSDAADSTCMVAELADSAQIATLRAPHSRGKKHGKVATGSRRAAAGSVIVVRRGETLSAIARRHGVSVASLRRANGLDGAALRAGQRLRIPASS